MRPFWLFLYISGVLGALFVQNIWVFNNITGDGKIANEGRSTIALILVLFGGGSLAAMVKALRSIRSPRDCEPFRSERLWWYLLVVVLTESSLEIAIRQILR